MYSQPYYSFEIGKTGTLTTNVARWRLLAGSCENCALYYAGFQCGSSSTRIAYVVGRDTTPNAALRLKRKDNLKKFTSAILRDTIFGTRLLIGEALGNLLFQVLSNTSSQPDTTLKGSMKRLVIDGYWVSSKLSELCRGLEYSLRNEWRSASIWTCMP